MAQNGSSKKKAIHFKLCKMFTSKQDSESTPPM